MYKKLKDIIKKGTAIVTGGVTLGAPALAERAEARLYEELHNTKPISYKLDRVPSAIDSLVNNAPVSFEARQFSGASAKPSSIDNMLSGPFAGYAVGKDVFIQYNDNGATLYTFKEHSRPILLKDGSIVTALDSSRSLGVESEPRKNKSILKPVGIVLGIIAIAGVVYYVCCSPKPQHEDKKIMIQAATDVVETDDNNQAVSNAVIKYIYNGNTITASPGQMVDVAEVNEGTTANVQIQVEAANHLTRKINSESMTGTHRYSINIKDTGDIDLVDLVNTLAPNNYFTRLKPPSDGVLNVYFNPDEEGTGKRLPASYINEVIRVFNKIKDNSNGKITRINVIRDGNKIATDVPNEGEYFIYEDTQNTGLSNIPEVNTDGSIKAGSLYFNSSAASIWRLEGEILDGVLAYGEQNGLGGAWDWVRFLFKRETGDTANRYRIFNNPLREEQTKIEPTYTGSSRFVGTTTVNSFNDRYWPGANSITGPSRINERTFTPRKNPQNQRKERKKEIKK